MNPFWIAIATKPAVERLSGDRAAEIDAMYRRPDAAPLPALPPRPGRLEMARARARSVASRIPGATPARRADPVRLPGGPNKR
jgi:hypothetical protein